jgi:hypothetical protein
MLHGMYKETKQKARLVLMEGEAGLQKGNGIKLDPLSPHTSRLDQACASAPHHLSSLLM